MVRLGLTDPDPNQYYLRAHCHSLRNRTELEPSSLCGCFYCYANSPAEIEGWIHEDDTALCPKCGIDSVIGASSGFPLISEFLHRMDAHWL
jgi:hypothetical protein